jgi:hypothetical protein
MSCSKTVSGALRKSSCFLKGSHSHYLILPLVVQIGMGAERSSKMSSTSCHPGPAHSRRHRVRPDVDQLAPYYGPSMVPMVTITPQSVSSTAQIISCSKKHWQRRLESMAPTTRRSAGTVTTVSQNIHAIQHNGYGGQRRTNVGTGESSKGPSRLPATSSMGHNGFRHT